MSLKDKGRTETSEKDWTGFENKVQQQVKKSLLALEKSMKGFEKKLEGYNLDTIDVTLKFTEEILGTGAEQDIDLTFTRIKN
jgi:hypothetical protein